MLQFSRQSILIHAYDLFYYFQLIFILAMLIDTLAFLLASLNKISGNDAVCSRICYNADILLF